MMKSKGNYLLGIIALLIGPASWLVAADFLPPAEGPVAFRRDRIPLEAAGMVGLSRHLEILARGLAGKSAEELRGAAQMLALSLALDPANTKARETLQEYQKDRHHSLTDVDQLERSRAKVWQALEWLETPDAGRQGQALANCLRDVIVISDPKHPKAEAIIAAGAKGEWDGWVSALSAYQKPTSKPTPKEPAAAQNDQKDKPTQFAQKTGGLLLEEATIDTVLWKNTGTIIAPKWIYSPAPLQMTGRDIDPKIERPRGFAIAVGGLEGVTIFEKTNHLLGKLVATHCKNLPNNVEIMINSAELQQSMTSGKKTSISAASAVLACSAVTGIEPDAVILGSVDETGAFKLPPGFWNQIRGLGKGAGRRLVLPMEAASLMPSLLAVENPGFFMDYEVLLAADLKQLLALTARSPAAAFLPILTKYQEIRTKSAGQDIRQYIANPYVRKRLAEISQEAPYHLSAKLLLLQSEGKRPTLIARKVLASELRRAIEPMDWIGESEIELTLFSGIPKMGDAFDACRASLDGMERYFEKNDLALFEQTQEVVNGIRKVEKAARARTDLYLGRENARESLVNLILKWKELTAMLASEAGESPAL